MEKLKGFLVNHFEKVSVFVALVLSAGLLFVSYKGEQTRELRDDLERLKIQIMDNRKRATIEPKYDPEMLKKQGGGDDEYIAVTIAEKTFVPPQIILREIVLEVPTASVAGRVVPRAETAAARIHQSRLTSRR